MTIRRLHLMGAGGVGMCGIAEVLMAQGLTVSGCDLVDNERTQRLVELGSGKFDGLRGDLFEVNVDALLGDFGGERSSHHPAADDGHTVQFPTHPGSLAELRTGGIQLV